MGRSTAMRRGTASSAYDLERRLGSLGMTITQLGNLSADWRVEPLGNLASEQTNRNPNLRFTRDDVLTVDNQLGLIRSDRKLGDDFSRYKIVGEHSFAYNPMRLNVGSIGLWEKPEPAIVSPDYIVFECNKEKLLPQFLDFFRRTHAWRSQIQQSGQGSIRIRYYFRHIAEFVIPVPSLSEQRTVAHVLRTVQQAKRATEKVIAATRQLKQSLMQHLFTYGPVPFDQADQVELKETDFGNVPKHWPVLPVGDACRCIVPGRTKPKRFDGDIPWITMPDLKGKVIVGRSLEGLGLSMEAIAEVNARIVPSGSVVMSCVGEFGIAVIVERDVVVNQQLHVFICPESLNAYFLCHALRLQKGFMERIAHFTTLPYLSKDKCNSVPIPLPCRMEQDYIATILRVIDRRIETEENRRDALDALFQSLLRHLMTGKVRIHDLELPSMKEGAP